jgi:hypothetical protein
MDLNRPYKSNLFSHSKNYIRFWNYGWKEYKLDPQLVLELMKSTKETTDEFCMSEETIYKSCGMPTRFRIGFSCAFREMNKEEFSEEKFRKLQTRIIKNRKNSSTS